MGGFPSSCGSREYLIIFDFQSIDSSARSFGVKEHFGCSCCGHVVAGVARQGKARQGLRVGLQAAAVVGRLHFI